ncbi:MAG: 23S rRNA (pseudouridine(1915)-N(3))-methyltransferase RlmH [Gammaproteobacteria bacterium]|nr:23S rRNA (pseudouridine(1915)-N(3))-methyltransferase RlmH [Gammaproteobacteria bacterium]
MKIRLVAVGQRMPTWVENGFNEYARRMPRECALELVEVAAAKRGRARSATQLLAEEAGNLLAVVKPTEQVIALTEQGRQYSTLELSRQMKAWLQGGRDMVLLVGGADGFAPEVLQRASSTWSLSRLTYAHPLVRVVLAEQLYRAWSVLQNRPYHRGD